VSETTDQVVRVQVDPDGLADPREQMLQAVATTPEMKAARLVRLVAREAQADPGASATVVWARGRGPMGRRPGRGRIMTETAEPVMSPTPHRSART
jgi:hypothetical protein